MILCDMLSRMFQKVFESYFVDFEDIQIKCFLKILKTN